MLDLKSEYMHYLIHLRLVNTLDASNYLIKYCIKFPNIRLDAILYQVAPLPAAAKPGQYLPALFTQSAPRMTARLRQIQLNLVIIAKCML